MSTQAPEAGIQRHRLEREGRIEALDLRGLRGGSSGGLSGETGGFVDGGHIKRSGVN